jgi:hypothetical protein
MRLLFCTCFLMSAASADPSRAATSYLPEPPKHQIAPMSLAQCTELIDSYVGAFGTPRVVVDFPTLRIVQFDVQSQTEQVACDGDSNVIMVFDLEGD